MPHAGFAILRRWMDAMPKGGFVLTSNVDGQFQKAGFDPARIVEIHGSIHAMQCLRPCSDDTWDAAPFTPEVDAAACRLTGELPRCPRCGGLARPNILMFGDRGWLGDRHDAQERALQDWIAQAGRVIVVEIGAGTAIPTVRGGRRCARRRCRRVANPHTVQPVPTVRAPCASGSRHRPRATGAGGLNPAA